MWHKQLKVTLPLYRCLHQSSAQRLIPTLQHLFQEPDDVFSKSNCLLEQKQVPSSSLIRMHAVLYGLPIDQQRALKQKDILNYVCNLLCLIRAKNFGEVLGPLIEAPSSVSYRTKCMFAFGYDHYNRPSVGTTTRMFRQGASNHVFRIDECVTVTYRPEILVIAQYIQDFLDTALSFGTSGTLIPYNIVSDTGFYRFALIRSYSFGVIVVLSVNAGNVSAEERQYIKQVFVSQIYNRLLNMFCTTAATSSGERFSEKTCSIYYEEVVGPYNERQTEHLELLKGPGYEFEQLHFPFDDLQNCCLKFRISPKVFFPIHLTASEQLYRTVASLCCLSTKRTVLLDICCGVGTIGQLFSPKVKRVVGIDACPSSIADAKFNAQLNGDIIGGAHKCEYYCGKVEDIVPQLINLGVINDTENMEDANEEEYRTEYGSSTQEELLAILDPDPRGLDKKAMEVLRGISQLKRLIYISCHKLAAKNYREMCSRGDLLGRPFTLKKIIAVDTFPLTLKYELVLLFERE